MQVQIEDAFWNAQIKKVQTQMLPFQWQVLNDEVAEAPKSGAINNFKIAAGKQKGEFYGMVFQDTDVYKWLEAVAYSLAIQPDPALEALADETIDLIGAAQMPDGYLNTYFQIFKPALKWTNLTDNHELYCFGHLIEAGVAYYEVTKMQPILTIITKAADLLTARFGYGQPLAFPGHPEIELALLRLYHLTKKAAYLELAKYFILERGQQPSFFVTETKERIANHVPSWIDIMHDGFVVPEFTHSEDVSYYVATKRLIDQTIVEGHAVRACYLYTALADLAALENDPALKNAAMRLFDNATTKQMYLTGGLGQTCRNEGFTHDYDLPNDTNYCETCAGISLIFWARKMLALHSDSHYAEVIERALYNNTLGAMALDGKSFYYSNVLEKGPHHLTDAARPKWHACACCPPNLARLLLSLNHYLAHVENEIFYLDQFIGANYTEMFTEAAEITVQANLPFEGQVEIQVKQAPENKQLAIRLPKWSARFSVFKNGQRQREGLDFTINQGYLIFHEAMQTGDHWVCTFELTARLTYANPLVKADIGKAALTRGPLVYCLEEEDNGPHLWQLTWSAEEFEVVKEETTNKLADMVLLKSLALREVALDQDLYTYHQPTTQTQVVTAIPFFARYNRSVGEMQVWTRYR